MHTATEAATHAAKRGCDTGGDLRGDTGGGARGDTGGDARQLAAQKNTRSGAHLEPAGTFRRHLCGGSGLGREVGLVGYQAGLARPEGTPP
jgi:hypothetical protein